jgi:hypothetical protein
MNLIYFTSLLNLNNIEYTIFYGTLLGISRDYDIIENDDDIDILLDNKYYNEILEMLKSTNFIINIDEPSIFMQLVNIKNNNSLIDLYFYENNEEFDYVIDKWNFIGQCHEEKNHLHIPKKYLFDYKKINFYNQDICIPGNSEKLCKFLYGKFYKENLIKNIDYTTNIVKNKPKIKYLKYAS